MPPRGVKPGSKRARHYEHITTSDRERGISNDRAEEIVAGTVEHASFRSERDLARPQEEGGRVEEE